MTFEITNHSANAYIFRTYEVQIRGENAWTTYPMLDYELGSSEGKGGVPQVVPVLPVIGPTGLVYCTVNTWDLPAKSVVRFSIRLQKKQGGLITLFKRAILKLEHPSRTLSPFDGYVWGKSTEVTSDEFVETVK